MKHTISLKNNRDFQLVYKKGKSAASKHIVVFLLKNNAGINRLGISVSKKMGHAVQRNRIRRRLREAFRLIEASLPCGHDLVILPRQNTHDATLADIKSQMKHCLRRHGVMNNPQKGNT